MDGPLYSSFITIPGYHFGVSYFDSFCQESTLAIHSFIHLYSALEAGPAGTRARLWNRCGSWHCISGIFLGIVCHCFSPPLEFPTFATTCLCVLSDARDPSIYLRIGMPMCGTSSIDSGSDTATLFVSSLLLNFASVYAITMVKENQKIRRVAWRNYKCCKESLRSLISRQ